MKFFKSSYILNKYEILFLLSSISDVPQSSPIRYILNQYLIESIASRDAVEGLVYKNLAKKFDGKIVLEPVVDLLTKSALSSDILWLIKQADDNNPILVLKSNNLYLHIRSYPHISDAWKITPLQNKIELLGEFDGLNILEIKRIDNNGTESSLEVDEDNTWIEDDII